MTTMIKLVNIIQYFTYNEFYLKLIKNIKSNT
jgi:hypothetical protein